MVNCLPAEAEKSSLNPLTEVKGNECKKPTSRGGGIFALNPLIEVKGNEW